MQEWLNQLLSQYVSIAPLIVFLALVIAALNIPISEDLTVIAAGIFIATVTSLNPYNFQGWATFYLSREDVWMHFALIFGAIGGDMISYVLGRKVGRPLLKMRLFHRMIPPHRLELLRRHFDQHATLTILLGRLIPFGVRNGISLCAGITHLPAWKFLLLDTISGSFSISVIYFLSKRYGYQLLQDIHTIQLILLLIFLLLIGYIVFQIWRKHQRQLQVPDTTSRYGESLETGETDVTETPPKH